MLHRQAPLAPITLTVELTPDLAREIANSKIRQVGFVMREEVRSLLGLGGFHDKASRAPE